MTGEEHYQSSEDLVGLEKVVKEELTAVKDDGTAEAFRIKFLPAF